MEQEIDFIYDKYAMRDMERTPEAYALTIDEYKELMRADLVIDRLTKNCGAIDDAGQSTVLVTTATEREIIRAFKKDGINTELIRELAINVFTKRKWYTILGVVDELGQLGDSYTVLTSDNERKPITETATSWDMYRISERAKELNIPSKTGTHTLSPAIMY